MHILSRTKPKLYTGFTLFPGMFLLLCCLLSFGSLAHAVSAADDLGQLPPPILVAPIDGAVVKGVQFTQSWRGVPGAQHYVYESYHNRQATQLRARSNTIGTTKTIGRVPSGTFWWRVRAVDATGKQGHWSILRQVTTDSEAPTIRPLRTLDDKPVHGTVRFVFESVDKNPWRITSGVYSQVPPDGMPVEAPEGNIAQTTDVTVTTRVTLTIDTLKLPNGRETIIINVEDRAGNIREERFYFTVHNPANVSVPEPGPAAPITGSVEHVSARAPAVKPLPLAGTAHSVAVTAAEAPAAPTAEAVHAGKVLNMQTEHAGPVTAPGKTKHLDSAWYWIPATTVLALAGIWRIARFVRGQIS